MKKTETCKAWCLLRKEPDGERRLARTLIGAILIRRTRAEARQSAGWSCGAGDKIVRVTVTVTLD